jgi:hypothetical protein
MGTLSSECSIYLKNNLGPLDMNNNKKCKQTCEEELHKHATNIIEQKFSTLSNFHLLSFYINYSHDPPLEATKAPCRKCSFSMFVCFDNRRAKI